MASIYARHVSDPVYEAGGRHWGDLENEVSLQGPVGAISGINGSGSGKQAEKDYAICARRIAVLRGKRPWPTCGP
jgi:hypothetical protein